MPLFEGPSLVDLLKPGLGNTPRDSLAKCMQNNLQNYEAEIKQALLGGSIPPDATIVCEVDRAFGKVYRPSYTVNAVPCLKTGLRYLFLLSVEGQI